MLILRSQRLWKQIQPRFLIEVSSLFCRDPAETPSNKFFFCGRRFAFNSQDRVEFSVSQD